MRISSIIILVVFGIFLYIAGHNMIERIAEKKADKIIREEVTKKVDSIINLSQDSILILRKQIDDIYREIGKQKGKLDVIQRKADTYKVPETEDEILNELKRLAIE